MRDCSFKEPEELFLEQALVSHEGKELTLDRAVDIARTYEMSQMKSMEASYEAVHSVNGDQRSRKDPPRPPTEPPQRGTCGRCRKTHTKDSCPAMGKTCLKCQKANHFANMCKTQDQKLRDEDVNQINHVFVDIEIGNKKIPVSFNLDTGAQVNVIPLNLFHLLECNNIESTTQRLFATPFLCSVYASGLSLTCIGGGSGIIESLLFIIPFIFF